jgi:hypothetical protein
MRDKAMNDLLKTTKDDTPAQIHAKVEWWCSSGDLDEIEDAGYILTLAIGEDARLYNPCITGTLAARSYDIGVSLAVLPWHYDEPQDEPVMSRSEGTMSRSPPQAPETKEVSIHSPWTCPGLVPIPLLV